MFLSIDLRKVFLGIGGGEFRVRVSRWVGGYFLGWWGSKTVLEGLFLNF